MKQIRGPGTSAHSENSIRFGFLLAGGKSSRMGADKAFIQIGGCTLLDRGVQVLAVVCSGVAVVGDVAKFANHNVAVIEDIYRDCGPLAGIHAALSQSPAEFNLVLAVDMPLVSPELLEFLFEQAENSDAIVTVVRIDRGFQPLCAVYRRAFAAVAEDALKAGKHKIDALFSTVPVRIVEENELLKAGFSARLFANLNTPEDLCSWEPNDFPG
ncbi:MAG TPA: molybdenum cofactor guanylyltransferase [Terriglobales bacterium]|nr:molybdenum cofactor guanylyltransferase [Terriglobales bacterium]